VFEAVGQFASHAISEIELENIEKTAIPGPGSCGGMYTANTMASAIEALGMSLPNSSAQDAISADKNNDCVRAGEAVLTLLENSATINKNTRTIKSCQAHNTAGHIFITATNSNDAIKALAADNCLNRIGNHLTGDQSAMLYPVGFKKADFSKPQVGIASTWSMVTPCNMHINKLADEAEKGVNEVFLYPKYTIGYSTKNLGIDYTFR
jgi:dihydroxyacid dehydratase/phosphogluconate dehydratase